MTNDIEEGAKEAYKKTKAGMNAAKNKIEDTDRDTETEIEKKS